jgi:HEAT repeat protein
MDLHTALDIKPLPTRRAELFSAYARQVLGHDDDTARMLEGVALAIQRGKPAPAELVSKSKGFLRAAENQTGDFIHALWRAYFAARAARLTGDLTPMANHLQDPAWREMILFYAGLGDASDLVDAYIQRGDWDPAGSMIANAKEVRADLREVVTKELIERAWNGDSRAPVVLGEMISDAAMSAFAARLKDPDPSVRSRAAQILGRLQLDRALEYLLPQMRDVNADTRDLVVQALGHSLSNRVIEPLLGAFRGDPRVGFVDTRLRVAAAKALGQVGSDKAVPALIVDLQTGEPEVRLVAAEALKRISSPLMIKPLKGILPSVDEETRKYITAVLATVNGGGE